MRWPSDRRPALGFRMALVPAAAAAAGAAAAAVAQRANTAHRQPFHPWAGWTSATGWAALGGGLAAAAVSARLCRTGRHHVTGALVGAGATMSSIGLLGAHLPQWEGPWMEAVAPVLATAVFAAAVLSWPTGRLEPRWRAPVVAACAAVAATGVAVRFVGGRPSPWPGRPGLRLPGVGNLVDGALAASVGVPLLQVVAPCMFLAAMARRSRMLPPSMRAARRLALAAGVVLAATEAWVAVADILTAPASQIPLRSHVFTRWRDLVAAGRPGLIALLLLAAHQQLRRAARSHGTGTIDLPAGDADLAAQVRQVLRDPTAVVEPAGEPAAPGRARAGRGGLPLVEFDAARRPGALQVRTATGAVLVARRREELRREVLDRADALRRLQLELLAGQDAARRALERDLHDGGQQPLVALALRTSLMARRGCAPAERLELAEAIDEARVTVSSMVNDWQPAVLGGGLAQALQQLAARAPLPCTVRTEGDIPSEHPDAASLYLAASEAMANALKHAGARTLTLSLTVAGTEATVSVGDDGNGNARPPASVAERLPGGRGRVTAHGGPGGSTVSVTLELERV